MGLVTNAYYILQCWCLFRWRHIYSIHFGCVLRYDQRSHLSSWRTSDFLVNSLTITIFLFVVMLMRSLD